MVGSSGSERQARGTRQRAGPKARIIAGQRRRCAGRVRPRRPSSGSRPPRWSSATRSSQPPTWVSPMKICGTVRRPVSCIMCARCAGSRSTRISSMALTPRCCSRALARMAVRADLRGVHLHRSSTCDAALSGRQSLQAAVRRTSRSAGWLRARPPVPPASDARVLEAEPCAACATARAGARAGGAHHHQRQRLVRRQRLGAFELAQRHVARAGGVAGGVLGRLADVDQHRLLAVDQAHRLGGATRRAPPPRRPSARAAGRRRRGRRGSGSSCRRRNSRARDRRL